MSHTIDIGVLELLASKICHDLISPVGAVANGVEFMEEMGASSSDEVIDLIKYSSVQASAKLQMYRMAYGVGGADSAIKPEDVYKSLGQYVDLDKKVRQDWDPHAPLGPEERPPAFCKMIMTAFILCIECLPKGGAISVVNGNDGALHITAEGENAGLYARAENAMTLALGSAEIDPRLVHPYLCGLLARHHNYAFKVLENPQGRITFLLKYQG